MDIIDAQQYRSEWVAIARLVVALQRVSRHVIPARRGRD
jgi:hypothetical protein